MKKCSVKYDHNVQIELVLKTWFFGIICSVVGLLGFASYLILGCYLSELWIDCIIILMFVVFVVGLTIVISINQTAKSAEKSNFVNDIEIDKNSLMLNILKDNKLMVSVNIQYKNLYKFKETKNYFFLFLTKNNVVPISKYNFETEECSIIKFWICAEMFKEKAKNN